MSTCLYIYIYLHWGWLYSNFSGKRRPRTASASYQHSFPTATASSTQFLPSSGYNRKGNISSVWCSGSSCLQPFHIFDIDIQTTHHSLLFFQMLPISSSLSVSYEMGSRLSHLKLFSTPPQCQAPFSRLSLLPTLSQTLEFIIYSSVFIHFTPGCNAGSTSGTSLTLPRSPMPFFPLKQSVLSVPSYCDCHVLETPLSWLLNFRNSFALLSYELAIALPKLIYIILITTWWSR